MENELIRRFIELRKKRGLTQGKFGELIGVSDVTISKIESGKITLNEKHIKLICGSLGINEAWFRNGTGPMLTEEAPGERQLLEAFHKMSPEGRRLAIKLIEDLLESEQRKGADASQNVPGDTTRPPEAPQEAKTEKTPIHGRNRV
jgi:transcriptional regulator with XRE-family HTH domain